MKAFIDESYDVGTGTGGFYVLAAVFARADEEDDVRSAMLAARARGQRRTHLRDEGEKRALLLAELVGSLRLSPLVVLGAPCSRPERVRAKCVERLAVEMSPSASGGAKINGRAAFGETNDRVAFGSASHVERVVIESRGPALDRNDRRVLAAVGARCGRVLAYEFPIGRDEPVLWAADIVASAVFQALRRDKNDLLTALGDITVLDIDGV